MEVTERPGRDATSALHDVLSAPERRHALDVLAGGSDWVTLSVLATKIAAKETGRPPNEVRFDRIKDVRIDLHHNHLPRLAEQGFVEYDDEQHAARLADGERAEWIVERLDETTVR